MKRLSIKRKRARLVRMLRRDMVHAAGCTHQNCACRALFFGADDDVNVQEKCIRYGVRVPRSVRRAWAESAMKPEEV